MPGAKCAGWFGCVLERLNACSVASEKNPIWRDRDLCILEPKSEILWKF